MSNESPHESGGRFALLYQLSQAFNSSLDLDQVLAMVIDEVISAIKAERGFVALLDDNGELIFPTARGMEQTVIDEPQFQVSRSIIQEVTRVGEAVLTSDAQHDDRFRERHSVVDLRLRSIICTPLQVKDRLLGVIYVDNRLLAGLFTQKDLELLEAIAASAAIAIENARLYQVAVEKGRIEQELQMAYRVQSSLIPEQVPQIPGWEFAASWQPARQVSGDYYDFIANEDGRLNLIIADVTDKGMPAALFMALTRSIVRASLDETASPAAGINKANRLICADSSSGMPVTLFAGQLDPHTGVLTYVNAGHEPPIHYHAGKGQLAALRPTGMFLGYDDQAVYQQKTVTLQPGDFIVGYTDGVLDAINPQGEAFGITRFKEIARNNHDSAAMVLLDAIKNAIKSFITSSTPYDDITILIARRL